MDCNNYSYAPNMLEDSRPYNASYENDDMSATIEESARRNIGQWEKGFTVWAGSYDGSLEVCEFYRTIEAAKSLYNAIVDNYNCSPPASKREVRILINQAKRIDRKGAKNSAA